MKLYIVWTSGGENEPVIDKIFLSKDNALDHVITTKFLNDPWYQGRSQEWLLLLANDYVREEIAE